MTNEALGQLYSRYGYLVHRRCEALLGNVHDANDALQETFMRVQRYPPQEVRSMLGWLYGIATRVCFDAMHAGRRASPWPQRVLQQLKELTGGVTQGSVEARLSLGGELLKLDETSRDMALLHWLEGLTQEEVAERTGYSRKTVGVKLKAAEAQLRAALSPDTLPGGVSWTSP